MGSGKNSVAKFFFFLFFVFSTIYYPLSTISLAHASEISVSARVDKSKLSIEETLTLTIVIEGESRSLPTPQLPAIEKFRTYSSSRSQNISIVNGEIFSSVTFRYILVPQEVGQLTIPSFEIAHKGQIYETSPIQVEVTAASPPAAASAPAAGSGRRGAPSGQKQPSPREGSGGAKKLFIQTYVDKIRPYVNEQVTLTFAFYRSIDLFENPEYEPPSTVGFWSEDLPPQQQFFKTIDGRTYHVTEIKTALFPTAAGDLTISPARLKVSVREKTGDWFSMDPFDIFRSRSDPWSVFGESKTVVLATEPIVLEAQPLPSEGEPSGFKGDIGEYALAVKVDKQKSQANQPVTLTMEVSGKGNIKTITSPIVTLPQGFKEYEGGGSEEISKDNYLVQGKKIFEKVMIPTIPGKLEIPPVRYTYFNPSEGAYKILESDPIRLEIAPSAKEEPLVGVSARGTTTVPSEVRRVGEDIRFIKTDVSPLNDQQALPWRHPNFWWIHSFPWLLLGLFYSWQRRQSRLSQDVVYARSQKASGLARRRLRQARSKLGVGDMGGFYSEVGKAILNLISDRLRIPTASSPMDEIIAELRRRGVGEETLQTLRALLDECDLARFAPSELNKEQMKNRLRDAESLIAQLEKARGRKLNV